MTSRNPVDIKNMINERDSMQNIDSCNKRLRLRSIWRSQYSWNYSIVAFYQILNMDINTRPCKR